MAEPATRNNARRDFYERIGGLSMAPLWESLHQLGAFSAQYAFHDLQPVVQEF